MSTLRPKSFKDIIGQKKVLNILNICVRSAKIRNDALPHILLNGNAGLGKTTIAEALANERGVDIQVANGGNCRSIKNIQPYLSRLSEHSILFIDEIHRLTPVVEEFLYPVMEDFRMDIGKDDHAISISLPKFTLIGATTEAGSLSTPLLDRFTMKGHLELYEVEDLTQLVMVNASKLGVSMGWHSAREIAQRGRGTPRITNAILGWVRDVCVAHSVSPSVSVVSQAMQMKGIEADGTTEQDRAYLKVLKTIDKPMGLNTLVSATNIDRETIVNVIEPFLIRKGLVLKTPKGRVYNE